MHAEIHGHRGARGLRPENTLPGFAHALELGVDALELDVALTADRRPVLTHDLTVSAVTSVDVRPAFRDDPAFPYVGRPVGELTLAQLRTLECGVRVPRHPEDRFAPTQLPVPNTRMPTLGSVLGLLDAYGADGVRVHVELKSDPTRPDLSADPGEFTELVVAELDRHRRLDLAAILSFDWRILRIARSLAPATGRYALIERATMDDAWLDGLHLEDFGGDIPAAAAEAGGTTLSPTMYWSTPSSPCERRRPPAAGRVDRQRTRPGGRAARSRGGRDRHRLSRPDDRPVGRAGHACP